MILVALACATTPQSQKSDVPAIVYPTAREADVVDVYHGVEVKDPYRWLEDPDAEETRTWIDAENKLTRSWIDPVEGRDRLAQRLEQIWDFERFGRPRLEGGKVFYTYNDGLQNQSVLMVADKPDAEGRLLIDPNGWTEDGTRAMAQWVPSRDGSKVAYLVSDAGSDWRTIRVIDVESGEVDSDKLEWVKFTSVAWAPDGSGFYYSRFPETVEGTHESMNLNHTVYWHQLGDSQDQDTVIHADPENPDRSFGVFFLDDGEDLFLWGSDSTDETNRLWVRPASGGAFEPLFVKNDAQYSPIAKVDGGFLYETNKDAPKSRVVWAPRQPEAPLKDVIPESDAVLRNTSVVGGRLFVATIEDVKSKVTSYALDGTDPQPVELPGVGTVRGFGGRQDHETTFFSFTSMTAPPTLFQYDVASGESQVWRQSEIPGYDADDYVAEQVFYESGDGTRVPMFIVKKKDLGPGPHPTYLYGYGGFSASLMPYFSLTRTVWMEMGGVYALPNIRGGGEYGREWHLAGTKTQKQTVFDDFIAAAEYLIDQGITAPEKLSIHGGSNGGLLVGATLLQRPDLFGAAIPAVGVMDMLRYHKFTIGSHWASDYGTVDDPEEFKALLAYSPVHNAKPGNYPATLITTADHDDRVVPAHSFKFAAALQKAQSGPDPVLIRVQTRAGHGAGMPTKMRIEQAADELGFLTRALDMQIPEWESAE